MIVDAAYFRQKVKDYFFEYVKNSKALLDDEKSLKIDLHCHDFNSNKSSEIIGRILMVAETWLPTSDLVKVLNAHHVDGITITNHNNAKSCWDLKEKGFDILAGAEFTVTIPEYVANLHVLTYGFTPEQERVLYVKRKNIYDFMTYVSEQNLVTILAHPFYFSSQMKMIPNDLMEKLSLIFSRFETINGQRDTYQNVLTMQWLEKLTPEYLESLAKKHGISTGTFCQDPYLKAACGGSDDHMGIYAGGTGTWVQIPNNLPEEMPISEKILEGLRAGQTAPYGAYTEYQRLEVALTDYFCQIQEHLHDPGLIRMLLHQGAEKDKWLAFGIVNMINELRRHNYTSSFFKMFHNAFRGKGVDIIKKMTVSKKMQPVVREIDAISKNKLSKDKNFDEKLNGHMDNLNNFFSGKFMNQLKELLSDKTIFSSNSKMDWQQIISSFELPAIVRNWSKKGKTSHTMEGQTEDSEKRINLGVVFDNLHFPFLASFIMQGLSFASLKAMHSSSDFFRSFAEKHDLLRHSGRALWLTDTYQDKNGIAHSIDEYLKIIRKQNLPIDILVCSTELTEESHLKILKPEAEFALPFYKEQPIRVPNILEIQKLVIKGGYDRIICSTEIMGVVGIYLKQAFNIPIYFFMHTDWLEFTKHSLKLEKRVRSYLKRLLRWFYRQYNGIFVLNEDHQKWLTGAKMRITSEKIFSISHWVNKDIFKPHESYSPLYNTATPPTVLFVGRLSPEKGVMILPEIYKKLMARYKKCRIIIVGKGPLEEELKLLIPNAEFRGWMPQNQLPEIYAESDIMILPSKFDTFGRVILEAMSCGCPVASFNKNGPKSIIQNDEYGILATSKRELIKKVVDFFENQKYVSSVKKNCLKRAQEYNKEKTISYFMRSIGLEKIESEAESVVE